MKGVPDGGGRLSDAEKQRRSRKTRQIRAALAQAVPSVPVVDSALGVPEVWNPAALEIARDLLGSFEHLRDRRWAHGVMSLAYLEVDLRRDRDVLKAMDPVKARTELLLYEETSDGMPSGGHTRRISEAQKITALNQDVMDKERLALVLRRELCITPAAWARHRAELERKKDFDFAMYVVEDEASAG